eukprot:CAMPEP_0169155158 /NCGR_PEP_ID=MMETSP1015-20121227/53175_1 /TAXON_ID=342587 /ORGANISM="Karlodinium micrum, Strain CCMP2283" /LENGTH=48 /DNA_ID= /DNA_START= /DNA_END= /DNA_ORIENTATION=
MTSPHPSTDLPIAAGFTSCRCAPIIATSLICPAFLSTSALWSVPSVIV